MELIVCNYFEHDDFNWCKIAYWNEIADDKLLERAYMVEAKIDGQHFQRYYSGNGTAKNKFDAYAVYWPFETVLETL